MDKPLTALAGPHTQFKRHPERGTHERAAVHAVVDEALICHLSFVLDGAAVTLPTAHARIDDQLYFHGAVQNRMLRTLAEAGRASATFTLLDGLVLARTAFHHSMNFRSVVVFGAIAEVVDLDEKRLALHALVEHVAPGRMAELDAPSDAELKATSLLRLTIEEASAKQRTGPPLDSANDLGRDVWAGEVPLALRAGATRRDPRLRPERLISDAARARGQELVVEERRGDHLLSSDRSRVEFDRVHRFLSEQSYWAKDVDAARLARAFENSLCFGAYLRDAQVGFARVLSDQTRTAYLCDVYIEEPQRGRGLGRALVQFALAHPAIADVDRVVLGTRDAHSFYERLHFQRDTRGRWMERRAERA